MDISQDAIQQKYKMELLMMMMMISLMIMMCVNSLFGGGDNDGDGGLGRDANCSFIAVFSTFFKLQILVILSKMPQNTFFLQGSLCVHFYGNKMKNTVFQAKILFSSSKILISFVRGWHLCLGDDGGGDDDNGDGEDDRDCDDDRDDNDGGGDDDIDSNNDQC